MADLEQFKITSYAKNIKDLPDKIENRADWLKAFFDGRTDEEVKSLHNAFVQWIADNTPTKAEVTDEINTKMSAIGAGDMQKSEYDTNMDGVVNAAVEAEHAKSADCSVEAEHAKSADSAAASAKLSAPCNINGVAFDGTKNITVADNTKLPLTGGYITGELHVRNTNAAEVSQFIAQKGNTYNALVMTEIGDGGIYNSVVGGYPLHISNTGRVQLNGNAATATTAVTAETAKRANIATQAEKAICIVIKEKENGGQIAETNKTIFNFLEQDSAANAIVVAGYNGSSVLPYQYELESNNSITATPIGHSYPCERIEYITK